MPGDLDLLSKQFRVFTPEPGLAEAVDGAVTRTAPNEEAVSVRKQNKGGINRCFLRAFAVKMLRTAAGNPRLRRHQADASGLAVGSDGGDIPHRGENGKTSSPIRTRHWPEAAVGEMSGHLARVVPGGC